MFDVGATLLLLMDDSGQRDSGERAREPHRDSRDFIRRYRGPNTAVSAGLNAVAEVPEIHTTEFLDA